jgi:cytosine/adenosine deaminase-related metal-dependent hydrolase
MDPWYPMGTHDMLEVAHMGAHCLQMMGAAQAEELLAMVTSRGAAVLNQQDYGIRKGNRPTASSCRPPTPCRQFACVPPGSRCSDEAGSSPAAYRGRAK